jgi:hypothetical protein
MTTVLDIVTRAFRKIGVTDPTGGEMRAGVDAFGDMVHGWRTQGIDVTGIDVALRDGMPVVGLDAGSFSEGSPFPMPEAFREGAIFMLATKLAPEFGASVTFDPRPYMRALRAHYMAPVKVALDSALTVPQPDVWRR